MAERPSGAGGGLSACGVLVALSPYVVRELAWSRPPSPRCGAERPWRGQVPSNMSTEATGSDQKPHLPP